MVRRWNSAVSRVVLVLAAAVLTACATSTAGFPPNVRVENNSASTSANPDDKVLLQGLRAAQSGHWRNAQAAFSSILRHDVRNARLQFLNGLAYEQLARQDDRDLLDLARVGYRNSIDFAHGNYWAHLHLGFLELERADYAAAQEAFAGAVKDQPQRWEALFGLGVASYYAGDLLGAALAADKARTLAPGNPHTLRLAAFALAASGEVVGADQAVRAYKVSVPGDAHVEHRIREILREVQLAQLTSPPIRPARDTSVAAVESAPTQIMVDVTIVLSSLLKVENRGVNLFDGLSVQYGFGNTFSSARSTGSPYTSTRTITHSINVPTLNYNLNLFNDSGQYYQVLARPTLTAFLGRESEFFAGRTVNVSVSGVNLGTLQPIDVGVGLKVTPEVVDGKKVTFRVSASRSFLSREEIGTFTESLTTFKQLVAATAEVEFGQTLLLSALSESVQDSNFSRVPVLGSIPGPNMLFGRTSKANRRESLLILLTPSRPATITTSIDGALRASELENLLKFWKEVVDPVASVEAITARLSASRFFQSGEAGDIRWSGAQTRSLLNEALEENVNLARR